VLLFKLVVNAKNNKTTHQ